MSKRKFAKDRKRFKRLRRLANEQSNLQNVFEMHGGTIFYELPESELSEIQTLLIEKLQKQTNRNVSARSGYHGASADFNSPKDCVTGHIDCEVNNDIEDIIAAIERSLPENYLLHAWKPIQFRRSRWRPDQVDAVLYLKRSHAKQKEPLRF
jgi:hypothetical protein